MKTFVHEPTKYKYPKMPNTTSTDIFGDAQCRRMVAKRHDCHFTTPAHKHINREMLHPHCYRIQEKETIVEIINEHHT